MKNTLRKDFVREIKKNTGRFLSIFFIVMLGTAFFSGVRSAGGDMKYSADDLYRRAKLMDIRVLGTLGLTEADLDEIRALPSVETVTGGYTKEVLFNQEDEQLVLRLIAITEGMNETVLSEGRMPQRADECVVDILMEDIRLGDVIRVESGTEDDISEDLSVTEYTVVGIGSLPYYLDLTRGVGSIGNGTIDAFLMVPYEDFTMDQYTEAYVRIRGAEQYNSYSDEYKELAEAAADEIEGLERSISTRRFRQVTDDAKHEIEDGKTEIIDGLKELADGRQELDDAAAELADGKTELEDAKAEIDDGQQKLSDAKTELADAKAELDDGEQTLADSKQQLDDAKAELDDGEQTLADSKQQLDDAGAQIASGEAQLNDAKEQLDAAKAQIDDGEKTLAESKAQLDAAKADLDDGEKTLADSKVQLDAAKEQVDAGEAQLAESKAQLDAAKEQIDAGETQLAESKAQLDAAKEQVDAGETQLAQSKAQLDAAKEQVDAGETQLAQSKAQLDAAKEELDAGETELAENKAVLDAAESELAAGREKLDQLKARLDDAAPQIEQARSILPGLKGQLAAAEQALADDPDNEELKAQAEILRGKVETMETQISTYDANLALYSEAEQTWQENNEKYLAGKAQYEAGYAEWETGKEQYEAGLAQYEAGYAEWEAGKEQYEAGLAQYEAGYAEWEAGKEQYEAGLAQYEAGYAEWEAGKEQYEAGLAQYEAGYAEWEAGKEQYEAGLAQYEAGYAEWEAGKEQYETGLTQYETGLAQWKSGKEQYESGLAQYEAGLAEWQSGKEQYEAGLAEYEKNKAAFDEGKQEYEDGLAQYEDGLARWEDGRQQYEDGKKQYEDGLAEWEDGKKQYEDGLSEYEEKLAEFEDGKKEYEDGLAEYEDGLKEYEDGEKEYADAYAEHMPEIEDGIADIRDAENKLRRIGEPALYVLDRDMIQSVVSFGQDGDRMNNLGNVFPVIFFLVAALVSLTAMTRMVDEQRQQIGTLKGLGFSNLTIAWKYLKYALIPSLTGGVIGVLAGEYVIPKVIIDAYRMMYTGLDKTMIPFNFRQGVLAVVVAAACTSVAAMAACYRKLLERPAGLMRPEAPKSGRRVFLEYVKPLWRRMNFTAKSTVRNLFRYKKRLFMTIIGIGACMGLMMVGFGLYDSITDVAKRQYREIFMQDATVSVDTEATAAEKAALEREIASVDTLASSMDLCQISATLKNGKTDRSALLYIPKEPERIRDFLRFQDRVTAESYDFPEEGVGLSEKTAAMLGVKVGDTISVQKGENGKIVPAKVTVIVENYVLHYCFMTEETYRSLFGEAPEYNEILMDYDDTSPVHEKEIGAALIAQDACTSVEFTTDFQKQIDDMLATLTKVILILLVSAGLLAFVVLYNLNNINITERKRELATLKVLGFRDMEVAWYVYRENIILTIIGILIGCVIGNVLHQFTILTVEVDLMMFGRTVRFYSYLLSAAITLLFALIVNTVMYFSLKKIDMIESLKSVE